MNAEDQGSGAAMEIGMTLPVMEPDVDAALLRNWAQAVDDGPFASLSWGERIAFSNPDSLTLLGAVAAWTERVRLITTVIVPQLHDPVMLAKALATADLLSDGRLWVGLGVGGRHEDYRAAGADPKTQTMAEMARRATALRQVWSGDSVPEAPPVGPAPVQPGGPPLLVGAIGPKTVRSAATWAHGLAGTSLDLNVAAQGELFDIARTAWAQQGRPKPYLASSFWYAIGPADQAREQVNTHLLRYLNWLPEGVAAAMAPACGFAGSQQQLAAVLAQFADIGADEVHLIPTSSDPEQLRLAAEVAQDFR